MSHGADAAELLDVDVDDLTWSFALISPDRFSRLIQPDPTQNTTDSGRRAAGLGSDLLARSALAAQPFDLFRLRVGRRSRCGRDELSCSPANPSRR